MKPIIGLIARVEYPGETGKLVANERYRQTIVKYGGNPIMILPPQSIDYTITKTTDQEELTKEEKEMLIREINFCDGILMPGGFKTNKYDRFITEYAIENDIPILGICLGMQIMSCYKKELQLVKNESFITHRKEEGDCFHKVTLDKNSKLFSIVKDNRFIVNSRHNYHAEPNDLFSVVAVSDDHIIEAIEMKDKKFVIGVQWHPEDMDTDTSKRLFEYYMNCCKKQAKTKE